MKFFPFICCFLLFYSTSFAEASDRRIGLGAGIFDTLDHMDTFTGSFILEGRPVPVLWNMRPTGQLLAIDDSGYYLALGLLKEFFVDNHWSCGLGFSVGAAHDSKESRSLKYDVEFYSRIFLQRQLNENNALRLELGHISNGGLHETNPGTEPLLLFWVHSF